MKKPYIVYCCVLALLSVLLILYTAYYNVSAASFSEWSMPPSAHIVEFVIAGLLCLETAITLWVLGPVAFWQSRWCRFDAVVTLLTL